MYKEHPAFEKPENENAKIWRYMDFTKFLDLLDKKALFFPRADKLGDPFEGSFPRGNVMLRTVTYKINSKDTLQALSEFYKQFRKFTAVSCWHLNKHESAAMWKLYLKSDEGIAIQSTFNGLKSSFQKEEPSIYIGKVKYLDYEKELMSREGSLSAFVHKRKSFKHEEELRAITQSFIRKRNGEINWSKSPFKDGVYVRVNLDSLVEKVYLAPTCPAWQLELVKSVAKTYELNKEVIQSQLYDIGKVIY
ncbi:MAG: hypothetical protein V3T73_01665 [Dehalococcoidales bacterium]